MMNIKNISVSIQDKQVLDTVSLEFKLGKNYCLLGKNGSGKSSLALTVMWHPAYEVTDGTIFVDGEDITSMDPHERAQKGIFLAFQSIPEIPGVKLFEFLRTIYSAKVNQNISFLQFKKIIEPLLVELSIDKEFLRRDVNVGFSGGERRKIEVLQLRLLEPKYIFLDEVDSWLDVDAFKAVAELIKSCNSIDNTFIIITHYFSILDYIPVDRVYVLQEGKVISQGTLEVALSIKEKWFWEL